MDDMTLASIRRAAILAASAAALVAVTAAACGTPDGSSLPTPAVTSASPLPHRGAITNDYVTQAVALCRRVPEVLQDDCMWLAMRPADRRTLRDGSVITDPVGLVLVKECLTGRPTTAELGLCLDRPYL